MQIRTVLNQGRASAAVSGAPSRELTGKQLAQTRLGHRSVLFGDWRKYYDAVRVVRAGVFGGRKVYGIQLESAGLPPMLVAVDAETGDVLQTQQTLSSRSRCDADHDDVFGLSRGRRAARAAPLHRVERFYGTRDLPGGARRGWRRTGAGHLHAPGHSTCTRSGGR